MMMTMIFSAGCSLPRVATMVVIRLTTTEALGVVFASAGWDREAFVPDGQRRGARCRQPQLGLRTLLLRDFYQQLIFIVSFDVSARLRIAPLLYSPIL